MIDSSPIAQASRLDTVKSLFAAYLDNKGQRKTPERFSILEEVYSRSDHFDVESLYIEMKTKSHRVSRATVYNTLDLLVECGLVMRHQFGSAQALYEKSYGYRQHDHAICTGCGKVLEFCDPRIGAIERMVGELLNFQVEQHSLALYGKCNECQQQT